MGTVTYRLATSKDVREFYGQIPRETIRAVIVCVDDRPAGILGIARDHGASRAFSEYKPALEPYLNSIGVWRAVMKAVEMFSRHRGVLYAVADHSEGARIMARLGFVRDGAVFLWPR